jgi:type IV secretory pathway TrbL component
VSGVEPIIAAEVIGSTAAAGAAEAAAAAAAAEMATAAAAAGTANPFLATAYGSLPGMTMGSQQAAMLAAQTGEFGLPGLMSTGGSATYAGAGGPLAKMAFSSGSPTAMRMGMQGMNMMQQSAPQAPPPPGIKRGQVPQGVDFNSLLAQPVQRKRISLL